MASTATITPHTRKVGIRNYSGKSTTVVVPSVAESVTEGTIKRWLVEEGGFAKTDAIVCEMETDKVTVEIRAPFDGIVTKHLVEVSTDVRIGEPVFDFTAGEAPAGDKKAESKDSKADSKESKAESKESKESKPESKESKADSKESKESKPESKPAPKAESKESKPESKPTAPKTAGSRNENRVKMTKMRARIAERLKDSQNTAAMLTTFNEVDMTNLMELRTKYRMPLRRSTDAN